MESAGAGSERRAGTRAGCKHIGIGTRAGYKHIGIGTRRTRVGCVRKTVLTPGNSYRPLSAGHGGRHTER